MPLNRTRRRAAASQLKPTPGAEAVAVTVRRSQLEPERLAETVGLVDDHLLDVTGITGHGGKGQQQGHADDLSIELGD